MDPIENEIRKILSQIPYGNKGSNVLKEDLVYSIDIEEKIIKGILLIPEADDRIRAQTKDMVETALKQTSGINDVMMRAVASQKEINPQQVPKSGKPQPQRTAYLQNYKNIILVASGKGGVGKSTLSLNLALSLKNIGYKVSLFDADIYGPSIPLMMGMRGKMAQIKNEQLISLQKFGIDYLSIGNLVKETDSMVWRGPIVHQAVQQMLRDSQWSGGDYMIIDMPPGTGDVQITISQIIEVTGAIIVCTPQDLALIDARKAAAMFDKVDIPIIGYIENMSSFICPKCGEETPIFSSGGTEAESKAQKTSFLGKIPLELDIRTSGDSGIPILFSKPDSSTAKHFSFIAENLERIMEEYNS